jgi:hypothetical protein
MPPKSFLDRLRKLSLNKQGKGSNNATPSEASVATDKTPSLQASPTEDSDTSNESSSSKSAKMNRREAAHRSHPRNVSEGLAAADKEMEERANRAKELLGRRYRSLRHDQVGLILAQVINTRDTLHDVSLFCSSLTFICAFTSRTESHSQSQ